MKATDLRIGNYIFSKETNKEQKITGLTDENPFINAITFDYTLYDEIEPILINEKWLNKFGFWSIDTIRNINFYKENFKYSIKKVEKSNNWLFCDKDIIFTHLQFVHELQNLYHALTHSEI